MSYHSKVNAINHLESYPEASIIPDYSNEQSIALVKELYELGVQAVWMVDESGYEQDEVYKYGDTIYLELDEISTDLLIKLIDLRPHECQYEDEVRDDFRYVRLWWD